MHDHALRPIERRMRKLADEGMSDVEIAWRFRRSAKNVRQVMALSQLPRSGGDRSRPEALRPIERRVLHWRDRGAPFAEMAPHFRRRPAFLRQVEQLARYKLAR